MVVKHESAQGAGESSRIVHGFTVARSPAGHSSAEGTPPGSRSARWSPLSTSNRSFTRTCRWRSTTTRPTALKQSSLVPRGERQPNEDSDEKTADRRTRSYLDILAGAVCGVDTVQNRRHPGWGGEGW